MTDTNRQLSATEVVERAFRALAVLDMDGAAVHFAEDLTYHLLNLAPRHQRIYQGRKAFLDLREQVDRVSAGSYTFDIVGIEPAGDELVILHAVTRAEFEGRQGGGHWVVVARVIDGLIVQVTDTPETALDHFWRPPAPRD